ncbi:glycosyltransferase [Aquabacter sp. L1I39]|uniref:glycosyltransferase n=1 Tax=Aquabacter sp. L1I39 TaxID=2820278 RepID=UPI001ADCF72B|nr:glycosyltransferase [Aquabacter sp. L1I39]QTL02830.1 glycosyltransferase [Aquabacter sp. L1I39]
MLEEAGERRKSVPRAPRIARHPAGGDGGGAGMPLEVKALAPLVDAPTLRWATARARALGVSADEVLVAHGFVHADTAAAWQGAHLGLAPAPDAPLGLSAGGGPAALALGFALAPREGTDPRIVLGARGRVLRRLRRALAEDPSLHARLHLVSPERFRSQVRRECAADFGALAAFGLRDRAPDLSAQTLRPGRVLLRLALALVLLSALLALLAPALAAAALPGALSALFLATLGLKAAACLVPAETAALPDTRDAGEEGRLPVYTLIVPLYREVAVLPRLREALLALDYPLEKLDIKMVVEPDDHDLLRALVAAPLPAHFEVVVAPDIGPRTKPKAMNAALPFARGTLVAVFDAEDVPHPRQLREAVAAFATGGRRLGCVQARLAIDNAGDSLISRCFALEYAVQFDVLIPALAAFGLPVPLGGTSNHFRRDALEDVGGWDPFNVTEDADLGLRLARMGWRTRTIASTTQEEAPVTVGAWLRQRGRWMKGWMQTLMVHGRHPGRLCRELGPLTALGSGLVMAAPILAVLVHPLCLAVVAYDMAAGGFWRVPGSMAQVLTSAMSYTNLLLGYGVMAASTILGARRRRMVAHLWVLPFVPLYWLLQSLATWRAVHGLVTAPYHWDKTEHGLSKRRAAGAPQVADRPSKIAT